MEPIHPQNPGANPADQPLTFRYRPLKSSLLFAGIWVITALFSLYLIRRLMLPLESLEALTLLLAAFACGVMAFHSLEQYGGPFLTLFSDHLTIHYSQMRQLSIPYAQIQALKVVREDLEILLRTGSAIVVNLSHLSFADQGKFLEALQDVLSISLDPVMTDPS